MTNALELDDSDLARWKFHDNICSFPLVAVLPPARVNRGIHGCSCYALAFWFLNPYLRDGSRKIFQRGAHHFHQFLLPFAIISKNVS